MIAERRQGAPFARLPESCPLGLRQVLTDWLTVDRSHRYADAAKVARVLQLSTIPEVNQLLQPAETSLLCRSARHPVITLLLCGLVPNIAIAALNNLYNFSHMQLDIDALKEHWKYVNGTVFGLSVAILLWFVWPVAAAVSPKKPGSLRPRKQLQNVVARCLVMGSVFWRVILFMWIATGVWFPLWNDIAIPGPLAPETYGAFFISQCLHGMIASSITFLVVTLVATRSFMPRLLRSDLEIDARPQLMSLHSVLDRHMALLGLTPACVLMAFALINFTAWQPMLILGAFGALGYGIATRLVPRIRATVRALHIALSPTAHLLYGESVIRSTS
jgi:hypothetical protein